MARRRDNLSELDPLSNLASASKPSSSNNVNELLQHKPDPELQKEIMREYDKVKADYDQKVMKDGYDFFDPSDTPTFQKIRVPLSVLIPRAPRAGSECVKFKDESNHTIATLPVTYLLDHPRAPPMRYYTHSDVNVVGKDEHYLSHIPYLGGDADIVWAEELLSLFDEGIHGGKPGSGKPINDWILFHVVEPILKRRQWKDFSDIQRLMVSLYELFPNKSSAKEMAASFTDLSQRFDPAKWISQTKVFNDKGEFSSHFPADVVQSSNNFMVCKRCYSVDCLTHSAEGTSTDAHIEGDGDCIRDSEEACGPFCFRHSLKTKSAEQNSQLEVSGDENVAPVKWTQHEETFMNVLLAGRINSPCRISQFLSNMSSSKTCKQVFDYLKIKGPVASSVFDYNRIEGNSRKLPIATSKRERAFRNAFHGKLDLKKPYRSCKHVGECLVENGCYCKTEKLMCTKYCGCSTECTLRFPGCRCKTGMCRTQQCPCYFASFECDPDLCRDCNCKVDAETTLPPCQNICIQRGLQRKLYAGPSEVAGIGCFAEEAIPKGEFIGEYVGEIISQGEAERRGKIYDKFKSSYLFTLNDEQAIDSTRIGNVTRFINHSKNPNCRAKIVIVSGDHRIGFYALDNIAAHDELFFDYSYSQSQACEFVSKERKVRND